MTTSDLSISQPGSKLGRFRSLLFSQEGILFIILLLSIVVLSVISEPFRTVDNFLNQGRQLAEVGLVALPMTYIIITGGIDLSVGSIFGLTAIVLGYSWKNLGLPLEAAIVLALTIAVLAGLFNGLLIVRMGVPPLIMTLATLALYRGLAQGISEGRSVTGYPDWFLHLGQGSVAGVPTQVWLLVISAIIAGVILSRTTFGRSIYAIGNNETGARFSGIAVGRVKLLIYSASGLMAGLAGWIFVSRTTTTRSDMGSGLELDVIAAVVLGGTSIFGGSGSIVGTVIGVVLIQVLKNGLQLAGITVDGTIVVIGFVLLGSVFLNNSIQRRRGAL
ncbi:MAG: ABC transporter permease [Anaerolineae bacterium]|nr:ABC transporter permease [Anaerolineae bacterium]